MLISRLNALVAAYSAPERHYHNLEHLGEMFRVVGRLASDAEDPAAIQLAIWFHDAVYDTHATNNEVRSGELAALLLGPLAVPDNVIENVAKLVRATAHLTSAKLPLDRDTAMLLDADLAILGAAEERYQRFARDIRKEYAWVPDEEYRRSRAEVLKQFLDRTRIYHHPIMVQEGEERARANLEAEIQELEGRN